MSKNKGVNMTNTIRLLFVAIVALCANSAFAVTPTSNIGYFNNEITTLVTHGVFNSEKSCKDCGTGTTLDVSAGYLRYLKDGWQVGGEGRFASLSKEVTNSKSETLIDLLGVGVYNFDPDLKNSIYGKAGVGFYSVPNQNGDVDMKVGLFLAAGKRFNLWHIVSYTPELRLVKKGDIDMGVEIALLQFSIFWN
jgi:hypothetical protein